MGKRAYLFGMALFLVVVFSLGNSVFASEYDKGKAIYEEKCLICHGADGKGDGPAASALSPPPRDFTSPTFWKRKDIDQIITKQVKNGKGPMPAFHFNEDEIKAIIDYMSHTFRQAN